MEEKRRARCANRREGFGTMNVPYAKKWQQETDKLRQIALDCELTEELKWGKPCFTFLTKNVAIVIPLNNQRSAGGKVRATDPDRARVQ